jgi:hypothetical protein
MHVTSFSVISMKFMENAWDERLRARSEEHSLFADRHVVSISFAVVALLL